MECNKSRIVFVLSSVWTIFADMLIKTKAIVLHSFKFGESKMITDLLTESNGRLSCITHISGSAKAKVKKQFFQPLTILEMEIDMRRQKNLHTIKEARISVPFFSIPFDAYKLSIALFTAEFLSRATRYEQSDALLYKYVENSVRWLDGVSDRFSNFHLVFMMRMTRFAGFFPNLDDYVPNCCFDMRNGCFTPSPPPHNDFLGPEESMKIRLLMRMNYETMHLYAMSRTERNRCVDVILDFYRLHVPDFKEIKSLDVLKELF